MLLGAYGRDWLTIIRFLVSSSSTMFRFSSMSQSMLSSSSSSSSSSNACFFGWTRPLLLPTPPRRDTAVPPLFWTLFFLLLNTPLSLGRCYADSLLTMQPSLISSSSSVGCVSHCSSPMLVRCFDKRNDLRESYPPSPLMSGSFMLAHSSSFMLTHSSLLVH